MCCHGNETRAPITNLPNSAQQGDTYAVCTVRQQNVSSFVETKNIRQGRPLPPEILTPAAKFHYIKTVSGKVVAQSIAFRAVSICWQGVAPFP